MRETVSAAARQNELGVLVRIVAHHLEDGCRVIIIFYDRDGAMHFAPARNFVVARSAVARALKGHAERSLRGIEGCAWLLTPNGTVTWQERKQSKAMEGPADIERRLRELAAPLVEAEERRAKTNLLRWAGENS